MSGSATPVLKPQTAAFWSAFLRSVDEPAAAARFYEVFQVGEGGADADHGARAILDGRKTATSSLIWEYEAQGRRPPTVGALSIVEDGSGKPVCVVETTWLEVMAFDAVDPSLARDYGEWDGTLEAWRRECWAYYTAQCRALGRTPSPGMKLLCERFRVIYRGPA